MRLNRNRRGLAQKLFGDTAELNNQSLVCEECHKYLHGRQHYKWSECWAAVYYSMFATQGFLNLSENQEQKLLTFIPDLQKLMWREHVVDTKFTQPIRNNWWTTRAQTEDITVELNRRKILSRNEARGGEFVYLMDKFAFANTRCPLGCEVYRITTTKSIFKEHITT